MIGIDQMKTSQMVSNSSDEYSNVELDIPGITRVGTVQIELADALNRYTTWPSPTVIVSDGPYGLGLFPGEPPVPEGLLEWYEPHVAA